MPSKVEQHFAAILDLIAGGMSIAAALRSDPRFPIKATWTCFVRDSRFPERRTRLEAAKADGKGKQGFKFQRFTDADYQRSLCLISDNFPMPMNQIKFDGCPGITGLWARSKSDADFAKRFAEAKTGRVWGGGRAPTYTDDECISAISQIRKDGLKAFKASRGGLPSYDVLHRRSRRDAALGERLATAVASIWGRRRIERRLRENRHRREQYRLQRLAELRNFVPVGETFGKMLMENDLYSRVNRYVPARMDESDRADVISDIIEAVLSGEIEAHEIEAVAVDFIKSHSRSFSSSRYSSIDAAAFADGDHSMLDFLTATEWSHEGAI